MRPLFKSFGVTVLAAATAALTWQSADAINVDCGPGGFHRVAVATAVQTTSSTTFIDVPGAAVDIEVNPGGCLLVEVSAQGRTIPPYVGQLRVVVDGEAIVAPSFVSFNSTSSSRFDNRRATFILRNVEGGSRVVKLQFASADSFTVTLAKVIMVVRYSAGA